jgi:hypothetical protein
MASDIFLLSGVKKVERHKTGQINGLCLERPTPSTENGALAPEKAPFSAIFFNDPKTGLARSPQGVPAPALF